MFVSLTNIECKAILFITNHLQQQQQQQQINFINNYQLKEEHAQLAYSIS